MHISPSAPLGTDPSEPADQPEPGGETKPAPLWTVDATTPERTSAHAFIDKSLCQGIKGLQASTIGLPDTSAYRLTADNYIRQTEKLREWVRQQPLADVLEFAPEALLALLPEETQRLHFPVLFMKPEAGPGLRGLCTAMHPAELDQLLIRWLARSDTPQRQTVLLNLCWLVDRFTVGPRALLFDAYSNRGTEPLMQAAECWAPYLGSFDPGRIARLAEELLALPPERMAGMIQALAPGLAAFSDTQLDHMLGKIARLSPSHKIIAYGGLAGITHRLKARTLKQLSADTLAFTSAADRANGIAALLPAVAPLYRGLANELAAAGLALPRAQRTLALPGIARTLEYLESLVTAAFWAAVGPEPAGTVVQALASSAAHIEPARQKALVRCIPALNRKGARQGIYAAWGDAAEVLAPDTLDALHAQVEHLDVEHADEDKAALLTALASQLPVLPPVLQPQVVIDAWNAGPAWRFKTLGGVAKGLNAFQRRLHRV